MGSPDYYGRQLDGLGGGISSLSKAVVVNPRLASPHALNSEDIKVDYTFIQVGVEDGELDFSGNCGNLTAAVGPHAVNSDMLRLNENSLTLEDAMRISDSSQRPDRIAVRASFLIHNTNTKKVIRCTFMVSRANSKLSTWTFEPRGTYTMPGVPGEGSEIRLQWLNPGGSKTASTLPTGNPTDVITVDGSEYNVSLVDISNPGIFIYGRDLGWDSRRSPDDLNSQTTLMTLLETIRRKGAETMGLNPNAQAVPKIVMVFPGSANNHIDCQAISMQKAHKAVPGTFAMNLGAACQIHGTIPHMLAHKTENGKITIGHPSGTAEVGAKITNGNVEYVELSRTARLLMDGYVFPARGQYSIEKIQTHSGMRASDLFT